ncbi:malate synthase A [Alicyclobacillus sp. SO9]|uniref:malate synthase A n=1 Tax=Alicyclobacillus sp. SO9 TaxID=2665646 RepID=UPI0018E8DB67|nr:malate synthase A [Alicyclobacillus sp. SO9]QQE81374.1 malate synthase A [Alicyclobacillus sp. SO9]
MTSELANIEIHGRMTPEFEEILTQDALAFVSRLHRTFEARRNSILQQRKERQDGLDAGEQLDFLTETEAIRQSDWTIPTVPADLRDRRVEITGPASDRKMVINALNSGARVFMADFEDANSPTWNNSVQGQTNLRDAVRRTIRYVNESGREYVLIQDPAVLIVRPRGWHLLERNVTVDGEPVSGSLFDFGLYLYHNAKELLRRQSGPYFYLPKLESHVEARLWNDVFTYAEANLGIPFGSIRATVLIETIPAAFEMDEILYELRSHAAGLNCGRWDYIFSYIKKQRRKTESLLPDRGLVTMTTDMMHNYSLLAIKTCHRRNAHAIGGMAAQIPIKSNPVLNQEALDKVRADKEREARDGHDGTWVAHPGLVPVAMEVFDEQMPGANQLNKGLENLSISAADLLTAPKGEITESGVQTNVRVGLEYTEAWLRGFGAVPINNLMEDAATAEISRAQLWQWTHFPGVTMTDGESVTLGLVRSVIDTELAKLAASMGEKYQESRYEEAAMLLWNLVKSDELEEFLTLKGYELLT